MHLTSNSIRKSHETPRTLSSKDNGSKKVRIYFHDKSSGYVGMKTNNNLQILSALDATFSKLL